MDRLVKVNNARGGRVVPTIKLAKAMADCFIRDSSRKISGYHMESLAIDAFTEYKGELDPKSMLVRFLGHSIKAVMTPIKDPTGQASHVDGYLGQAKSKSRKVASTQFGPDATQRQHLQDPSRVRRPVLRRKLLVRWDI